MFRRYIISLFCILVAAGAFAQQPGNFNFINFGIKDGLPDKYIYCAAQDNRGYMWFGTGTGLYRYDGHSFKQFRSTADKPGRVISNILQVVNKDEAGNLWLGSLNALQWYNPEKNIFWAPDYNKPETKKLADAYIVSIHNGENGAIWLGTSKNYFYCFNPKDSSFTSFATAYPPGASANSIHVYEINQQVYAIHAEGVYIFSLDRKFVQFIHFNGTDISNSSFTKEDDAIWLTTFAHGFNKFTIAGNSIKRVLPENKNLLENNLFCVAKSNGNDFFMGGYPLHLVNTKTGTYTNFLSSYKKEEYSIGVTKVANLFFDREHNLWLCSFTGLSMIPWQNNQVKTVELKDNKTSAEPTGISAIKSSGDLLISSTNTSGLLHYETATGKLITVKNVYAATGKSITAVIIAPDSSIYLSDNIHFFKYLPEEKKMIPFQLKDQDGKDIINAGRNVYDKKGNVFIASYNNGFYKWEYSAGKLLHYNKWDLDKDDTTKADNEMIPCLADSEENIWFTCKNGVWRYNTTEKKYYHYANKENEGVPLMGSSAYIEEDRLGHYWITTIANGLYELYFEKGKDILKNYTKNSGIGLPADYCKKIKQNPADSSLWISNITGLLKFDPIKKRVLTVMNQQNGFSADDGGYTFSIINNQLAQLYYGKLNIIDLERYKENRQLPVVFFNSVKVLDKEYAYQNEQLLNGLKLQHNENFLQFEFAALVFNNSNKNQYMYKLEGIDKDWIYSGQKNTVSYSELKPGSHVFKVKAANSDGCWGKQTTVIITIQSPFYASWWFLIIAALLFGSLVFGWNRHKINQLKKEQNLKASFSQQITETEMKALRAQMNPHFIFNSLNSIQKYILKNDQFAASQYLTKFARLIRLILDQSNQSNIILSDEIEMLKLYVEMESLRFDDSFYYSFKIAEDINSETVAIPSMLIQPYVENAIWHGLLHKEDKGKLLLDFSTDANGNLQVVIEDNGIGREKAAELKSKQVLKKKSYGMQIAEDRISAINRINNSNTRSIIEDIKDENGNTCGTKVILLIPLQSLTINKIP